MGKALGEAISGDVITASPVCFLLDSFFIDVYIYREDYGPLLVALCELRVGRLTDST
jgi:hypothetical protein